ncbi:MAG: glycosyltransferase family 4 protein [Candidatus Micrarchaeota archaeon]|nr:glycosyltransferase family 4 protein [Candidatus Micrarchaeota archaeon]
MRIAFVYDAVYPYTKGGVEIGIYEISKELSSHCHEVHCFGIKFWKGPDIIEREGVYLHGVCSPAPLYTASGRRSILKPIHFSLALIPALLKEGRFDVINCQSFPYFPVFSCKIVSKIKGSKLFVTWYELWGDYWYEYLGWPLGFCGKIVERLALTLSSNIISVSEFTRRKIMRKVDKKIPVFPNGVDYESLKKAKPLEKNFDVIFIGRLIKEKNVDVLLRAVALLRTKHPKIRCCVIGEGPEKSNLVNLVSSLKIKNNINFYNFLPAHEKVFSYIKSSKVLALPSSREGFGMVALEANACGVPVLTVDSDDNAVKDFVKDGVNGKVVKLADKAIADGIEQLFGMKVKIKPDEYKWSSIAKRLEEVYRA